MEFISPNKVYETKLERSKKGLVRALLFMDLMYYKERIVTLVRASEQETDKFLQT